jgi:hypothetical protein
MRELVSKPCIATHQFGLHCGGEEGRGPQKAGHQGRVAGNSRLGASHTRCVKQSRGGASPAHKQEQATWTTGTATARHQTLHMHASVHHNPWTHSEARPGQWWSPRAGCRSAAVGTGRPQGQSLRSQVYKHNQHSREECTISEGALSPTRLCTPPSPHTSTVMLVEVGQVGQAGHGSVAAEMLLVSGCVCVCARAGVVEGRGATLCGVLGEDLATHP